jgi:hypothetical protein
MTIEYLRGMGAIYAPNIIAKLRAERVTDTTDETLEQTLGPCVCGVWLVPVAKQLRDDGQLNIFEK